MTHNALQALIDSKSPLLPRVAKVREGITVVGFLYYHIPSGRCFAVPLSSAQPLDDELDKLPTVGRVDYKRVIVAKTEDSQHFLVYCNSNVEWLSRHQLITTRGYTPCNYTIVRKQTSEPYIRILDGPVAIIKRVEKTVSSPKAGEIYLLCYSIAGVSSMAKPTAYASEASAICAFQQASSMFISKLCSSPDSNFILDKQRSTSGFTWDKCHLYAENKLEAISYEIYIKCISLQP